MVNSINTMGSSFLLEEGRFPSFDEKVCSVICEGLCEDLEAYLVKGLDPNHILNSDVLVQGKLFLKGTPIIFLVLHCCTITHGYGEPFGMIRLLLERGVDLEKRFLHGGGYTSVLEHACENADNLLEEILVCLLRAASPQASHAALDKINNPEKKERIKKQVLLTSNLYSYSSYCLEEFVAASSLIELSCSNVNVSGESSQSSLGPSSEELILQDIFSMKEEGLFLKSLELNQLKEILKTPLLLQKCDERVRSFCLGETFFSFLILNLKDVYVKHRVCLEFFKYGYNPGNIVSSGKNLVEFLCGLRKRSKDYHNQVILLKTLSAVFFLCKDDSLIELGFNQVSDECDRKLLEGIFRNETGKFSKYHFDCLNFIKTGSYRDQYPIISGFLDASLLMNSNVLTRVPWNTYVFTFLNELIKKLFVFTHATSESNKRRERILMEFFEYSLSSINNNDTFTEEQKSLCLRWLKGIDFIFKDTDVEKGVLNLLKKYWGEFIKEDSELSWIFLRLKSLSDPQTKTIQLDRDSEDLLASIRRSDFSLLEKVLQNQLVLKDFKSKILRRKKTLFSFIMTNIEDVFLRHKICLKFLKYGCTPYTIVKLPDTTMFDFLCLLRNKMKSRNVLPEDRYVLMETLFLVLFFCNDNDLELNIKKLNNDQDRKQLEDSFKNTATGTYSKSHFNSEDLIKMWKYRKYCGHHLSIVRSFIEASLMTNINVATGQPWSGEQILPLLSSVKKKLLFKSLDETKKAYLNLFDFLLESTMHTNSFNESSRVIYKNWFDNEIFIFEDSKVERDIHRLFEKYWGNILDRDKDNQISLETASTKKRKLLKSKKRSREEDNRTQSKKAKI